MNSGAEAVENAVKVARYATGRSGVVAFDHGFHGRTLLGHEPDGQGHALQGGVRPLRARGVPGSVLRSVPGHRHAGRDHRRPRDHGGCGVRSRAWWSSPSPARAGSWCPSPAGSPGLAQWCQANGVVFVADEIQSGFGRTGAWFACEHEGVVPDIVTTAKSLGGGLPISAVTGRAELMDAVHPGGLGGTFGGNPLACAAALAAIDTMERDGLLGTSPAHRGGDARPAPGHGGVEPRRRRRPGPRGDGRHRARGPRRHHPRQGGDGPGGRRLSRPGSARAELRAPTATCCACCPRS